MKKNSTNFRNLVLNLFLVNIFCFGYSQVGINTSSPESTFDIRGKNHLGAVTSADGLLVPRVNNISVSGSINGQLVYLVADQGSFTKGFYYWNGTAWTQISGNVGDPTSDSWINSGSDVLLPTGSVGIGGSPNGSSILDMSSITNKGMSIPNVNLTSITDNTTITSPQNGLIVFNKTALGSGNTAVSENSLYVWNSNLALWDKITSASNNIQESRGSTTYKVKHRGRNLDTAGFPKPTLTAAEMNVEFRWATISGNNYFQVRLINAPTTNVHLFYTGHWQGNTHSHTWNTLTFTPANYNTFQSVDGNWSNVWGYYYNFASDESRSSGYNPLNYIANMYGICGFGNGWGAANEPYSLVLEVF